MIVNLLSILPCVYSTEFTDLNGTLSDNFTSSHLYANSSGDSFSLRTTTGSILDASNASHTEPKTLNILLGETYQDDYRYYTYTYNSIYIHLS